MAPHKPVKPKPAVLPEGVCDSSGAVVASAPVRNMWALIPKKVNRRTRKHYKKDAQTAIDITRDVLDIKMPKDQYLAKKQIDKSGALPGSMLLVNCGIIAFTLIFVAFGSMRWADLGLLGSLDDIEASGKLEIRRLWDGFIKHVINHLFDEVIPDGSPIKRSQVMSCRPTTLWNYCNKTGRKRAPCWTLEYLETVQGIPSMIAGLNLFQALILDCVMAGFFDS